MCFKGFTEKATATAVAFVKIQSNKIIVNKWSNCFIHENRQSVLLKVRKNVFFFS